ncbi:FMRFamide peptide receptor frpr-18-like [Ruditapes philippinarum]|uniref:FMRFamide peptide receptor frpr-18-like n=1 Tax=Ruditapes philippinarum TaxID=129788 RepID=UPI00295B1D6A|nr:FMRFamide peptide receptor frpr-18-like [Ruditapes philippinarum]
MNINESIVFDLNFSINTKTAFEFVTVDPKKLNITQQIIGSPHNVITVYIEKYVIPIICLLGLIGNTLSSIVFLRKPIRNSSCSIFLCARGFSDNGFLSTLLIIWISRTFQLRLGEVQNSCQIIIFLTYVCGCTSVWLVVFVTVENYIRICRPFIVNRVCTTKIAKVVVGILWFVTLCIYNFPFWTMSPDTCVLYGRFHNTVQVFVYADTFLTLVVPIICITLVMIAIVCSLLKSYNRRSRLRAPTAKRIKNPMAKVTKMLFAVTVTFICLNLPSHINRLRIMISSILEAERQQGQYSSREEMIQQITLLVSYLSLTINLLVYVTFGSRFRKVLKDMFHIPEFCLKSANESNGGYSQELIPIINNLRKSENQSQSVDMTSFE